MRRTAIVSLALVAVLAGCGGSDTTTIIEKPPAPKPRPVAETPKLTAADSLAVARFEVKVAKLCVSVARVDADLFARSLGGVYSYADKMIALYRAQPDALYSPGEAAPRTMKQVLSDNATDLRRCKGESIADDFDQALDAGT